MSSAEQFHPLGEPIPAGEAPSCSLSPESGEPETRVGEPGLPQRTASRNCSCFFDHFLSFCTRESAEPPGSWLEAVPRWLSWAQAESLHRTCGNQKKKTHIGVFQSHPQPGAVTPSSHGLGM